MHYEGDPKDTTKLECVFVYHDQEYRYSYSFILSLAALWRLPLAVRDDIMFWAQMINNPD